MAQLIKHADVIALQEIVTNPSGAQTLARLIDELDRTGARWDYAISDPTQSSPYRSERYAYLWKSSTFSRHGKAWLEPNYAQEIEREPYMIRLKSKQKIITLVNFHALPKKMQPEREIKFFKFLPALYANDQLIFCGDFNLPQSHSVFNPLKKLGFDPVLEGQKTSLRQKCIQGDCLASEYDNIFLPRAAITPSTCGIIPFHLDYQDIKQARLVSDHVPVFVEFSLN